MTNPFTRLPFSDDPQHYFRTDPNGIIKQLVNYLQGSRPLAFELVGLPGMGKTATLRYLASSNGAFKDQFLDLKKNLQYQAGKILPVHVEYRHLPADIAPYGYLYRRFAELIQDVPDSNFPSAVPNDPLPVLLRYLEQYRIRPVFLLDDFDRVYENMAAQDVDALRPLRKCASFVAAVERPLHEVNPRRTNSNSMWVQVASLFYLGSMTEMEASSLVNTVAKAEEVTFPPADVAVIVHLAGGHPALLVKAARALWDIREKLGLLNASETPLDQVYRSRLQGGLEEESRSLFNLYWDRLSEADRSALIQIAANPDAIHQVPQGSAYRLETRGLIVGIPTKIFSPCFEAFIREMTRTRMVWPDPPTEMERKLHDHLKKKQGQVCSFEELAQEVWLEDQPEDGEKWMQLRRRIQVTVSRLRGKLPALGEDIISIRDQGYQLVPAKPK